MQIELKAADLGGPPEGPDELMAKGWVYRDLPRMTPELFDQFVGIVAEENLKWLTIADYGNSKRGQIMISPKGMEKLAVWLTEKKSGASGEDAGP